MDRTLILSWILLLCITTAPVYSQYYLKTVPCVPKEKKVTNLHFFFHGTIGGKNPTAVTVARANITSNGNSSPAPSNSIVVDNAPLTIGPEPTSEVIGNAQGLEAFAGRDTTTVVVYLDFGFTKGDLNGSSISVFSRNPATEKERELAVVGGRGKFRIAQGFALLKTFSVDNTSFIVEYNVTLIHYHSQILPCDPKAAKVTNLHFFLHETTGGRSPTSVTVAWARANISSNGNNSSVPFGNVVAIDDPLTVGPEHNSEVIGNAQGLGVSASKNTPIVVLYLDFGFIKGKFNGSSISILSRNPVTEKERELAVVGGRGKFRMAKGFAQLRTYFINQTTLIAEYNVTVIHY